MRNVPIDYPAPTTLQGLADDYLMLAEMFRNFDDEVADDARLRLADRICMRLSEHLARDEKSTWRIDQDDTALDEKQAVRAAMRYLVARIPASCPTDVIFDAMVKVLGVYLRWQVHGVRS